MTANSTAVAAQPTIATAATIALNNEPAGLASHDASRPAGERGGDHGQSIRVVHARPFHHRMRSELSGSGYHPATSGSRPG